MIHDPFDRSRLPIGFTREDRIRLLAEFRSAVLEGRPPPAEAAMFLASALDGYLQHGGDLARDFLRITPPRGSHRTPRAIARHHDEGEDLQEARSFG